MVTFLRLEVNIFSLIICIAVFAFSGTKYCRLYSVRTYRLFAVLLCLNICLLTADSLMWATEWITVFIGVWVNRILTFFYYIFCCLSSFFWYLFIEDRVRRHQKNSKRSHFPVSAVFLFGSLSMVAANPFFKEIYSIDSLNNYHRGGLFMVFSALFGAYIILSYLLVFYSVRFASRKELGFNILILLPFTTGGLLQFFIFGVNLLWPLTTLSLVMINFYYQNQTICADYLTGLFNRMQADEFLSKKIHKSGKGHSFSGIMIDINDFKQINDLNGHQNGDEALKTTARILRGCLLENDFAARFGGDEFLIILDTDDPGILKETVAAIREAVNRYNNISKKPYKINFSIGYDVYDTGLHMTQKQFIQHIDQLMYANKRKSKNGCLKGNKTFIL